MKRIIKTKDLNDLKTTVSGLEEYRILDNNNPQKLDILCMDDECTYYEFALGLFAKYDPKTQLYYSLDENNNWVLDNRILSWLIGAEYDYVEIEKNDDKGKKI